MRVVAALGGNALLRRAEPADAATQRRNVTVAATVLARLARHHELIVTHGNGPQAGLLALQSEANPYPLDVLTAETQGMIGYLLEQGLRDELPASDVATLVTQVVVHADDPAFGHPTKPIGPVSDEAEASALASRRGWSVAPDGAGWRRVVASPEPRRILGLGPIRAQVDAGVVVVAVGGGGVAVAEGAGGCLRGVEAVIDKDLSAALLAQELDADALLLLTDVAGVQLYRGAPATRVLRSAAPAELRALRLSAGSMGPKAEAAARFVEATGRVAAICALEDATAALASRAGTRVRATDNRKEKLRWTSHSWDSGSSWA